MWHAAVKRERGRERCSAVEIDMSNELPWAEREREERTSRIFQLRCFEFVVVAFAVVLSGGGGGVHYLSVNERRGEGWRERGIRWRELGPGLQTVFESFQQKVKVLGFSRFSIGNFFKIMVAYIPRLSGEEIFTKPLDYFRYQS